MARLYADKLSKQFGQQVVVTNRAGAGGMIGAQAVANAPADGYTVLFANSGHAILGAINKNLTFDPIGDFAGVFLAGEAPGIVVVPPSLGVSNLKEFVELAKSKPGTINYGSAGIGTSTHLAGAYFALKTGIDIVHVPYTVSATIIADLLGGRIQASFVPLAFVLPLLQDGRLRALAVGGRDAGDQPDLDPDRAVAGFRLPVRHLVRHAGAGQDAEARPGHAQSGDGGGEQGSRAHRQDPRPGHRAAGYRARPLRRPCPGRDGAPRSGVENRRGETLTFPARPE